MLIRAARRSPAVSLVLLVVSLGGCRSSAPPSNAAEPASHGLDVTAIDRSVDPGDDFYAFANGAWLKRTEIPADRSTWGPTEVMTEEAASRTRELLETAAKPPADVGSVRQQAADYFASYMDEQGIESKGLGPVKPLLDRIAAIDS